MGGDGFSFWLGRRYQEKLRAGWPLSAHPELFARGQAYLEEHGGKSVFLARFLGPVRAIVPVVAGMSGMPLPRFTAVNVFSAVAWSAAHLLPGALFGASLQLAGAVRYAPRTPTSPELLVDWRVDGWQRLPARRTEVDGDHEEPLSVQWAGTAHRIVQVLEADGWRRPPPWTLRTTLLWLLPSTAAGQLPVLAKFHRGESPALTLEKELDASRRLVIRLWPTPYQVGAADELPVPLWIGMVSLERLERPAGMATLAMTARDVGMPTAQLAQSLQAHGVGLDIKRPDASAVLLLR